MLRNESRRVLKTIASLVACVAACGCHQELPPQAAPGHAIAAPVTTRPGELAGIRAALEVIPKGIVPTREDGWTDAKVDAANRALAADAAGKKITLKLKVREVIRWKGGYALNGPSDEVSGLSTLDFWIYFQPHNASEAALLNVGQPVTVTGRLNAMRFDILKERANAAHLYVEVDDAHVVGR